jgi:hypothetical protein
MSISGEEGKHGGRGCGGAAILGGEGKRRLGAQCRRWVARWPGGGGSDKSRK